VKSVKFCKSSSKEAECPTDLLPEFAFIGRSNVGKSSLINSLTNCSNLAKVSTKPGKTLLINHFLINDNRYLVDLPGYGFADVGKKQQEKLITLIDDYIRNRKTLACLLVLIDFRHSPQEIDLRFIDYLIENTINYRVVFTKIDKLTAKQYQVNEKIFQSNPKFNIANSFFISNTEKKGIKELSEWLEKYE
jgi:GTP-binding protein